jgi:hypothetical protein
MGSFITAFVKNDTGATISRVVKYGNGASYIGFASDSVYNGTDTINSGDFFIIKVSAQDGVTTLYYKIVVTVTYEVGDSGPGGGIIFYVASTPFACGPTRSAACTYLEAAPALWNGDVAETTRRWADPSHQSSSVGSAGSPETATATAVGWGYSNTRAIISQGNTDTATSAAALADSHTVTVGGVVIADWHLPSQDELNQMCKWQRGITGDDLTNLSTVCTGGTLNSGVGAAGFEGVVYWPSTEADSLRAQLQNFFNGDQYANPKFDLNRVRPIRAF